MALPEDNGPVGGSSGAQRHRVAGWLSRHFRANSRDSAATQSYRRLALQLDFDLGKKEKGHSLMLTAPDSAGITCEATLELAHFLAAELGHRVLLVDGSFGVGGISALLGHEASPGLMDLPRDGTGVLGNAVVPTGQEGVFLLAAGRPGPDGAVPIRTDELRAVLEAGCAKFDYVLVPSCPILRDPRCLVFPSLVDLVLLLAVEGKTFLDDLDASRRALTACKATKVGLVLTKQPRRWLGRR